MDGFSAWMGDRRPEPEASWDAAIGLWIARGLGSRFEDVLWEPLPSILLECLPDCGERVPRRNGPGR